MFLLWTHDLGEVRARRTALLGLVTVFGVLSGIAGCKHNPAPIIPRHSVRISALLPLHPSWEQLRFLEEQAKDGWNNTPPMALRFTPVLIAPPFTPPHGLPASRVADHEKVVREDADRYIAQLETALAIRNRELTEAERHAAALSARTKYNSALEMRVNELRDAAVESARVQNQALNQLDYRLEALASQTRVYTAAGPSARRLLDDVKLQQTEVDRRAQLKTTEIYGLLHADFKGLARESLKSYQTELNVDAAKAVAEFQLRQSRADEREISEARTSIDSRPASIPPLQDNSTGAQDSRAASLVQGIEAPTARAFDQSSGDKSYIDQARRRENQWAIVRLKAMIEDDTRKAIIDMAQRERWTLAPQSAADDWTARVAAELRSLWKTDLAR